MGKFKLLVNVVEDIRHLADSLEELVSVIGYNECGETAEAIEDSKVEECEKDKAMGNEKIMNGDKERVLEEDKRVKKDADKEISLEEVRGVLAKKSQEGFTDEIRSIIKAYNCEKLSEINSKYYLEILQKAKQLGDK